MLLVVEHLMLVLEDHCSCVGQRWSLVAAIGLDEMWEWAWVVDSRILVAVATWEMHSASDSCSGFVSCALAEQSTATGSPLVHCHCHRHLGMDPGEGIGGSAAVVVAWKGM